MRQNLLGTGVLVGPAVTHGGGDKTFGWVKSNSEAKAVTTSYTIQDNDPYNVYSLNVYKGKVTMALFLKWLQDKLSF
jgi:hypothetical protein